MGSHEVKPIESLFKSRGTRLATEDGPSIVSPRKSDILGRSLLPLASLMSAVTTIPSSYRHETVK